MKTASWVLLTIVAVLTLLLCCVSAYLAYLGDYPIGGTPVADVAAGRPEILTALRGIRGTSAAYGAGFAVFLLATVLGPYRRGDRGAWWTLLAAAAVVFLFTVARVPLLGVPFGSGGSGPSAVLSGLVLLGLLLDVGRLKSR
jgi:hypothetical protein